MTAKRVHVIPTISICIAALSIGAAPNTAVAVDQYKVDASHAAIIFRIQHLGMSYTYGRFNSVEGKFAIDSQKAEGTSLSFSVKSESIDTGFKKRDDHLRSPDFFNARQFPVITFQSTSIQEMAGGYHVVGNLSLHGTTKAITVDLKKIGEGKDPWGNYRMGFAAELTIQRSEFGMTNMPEAVGDLVELLISFEGIRQ